MRSSVNVFGPTEQRSEPLQVIHLFSSLCESVIPMEIQILSPRVALEIEMTDGDNHRLHLQGLEALDEKRLQAQ